MKDTTIIRYARLYKRYLETVSGLGEGGKYYPQYYLVEKAAGRDYAINSARCIINRIQRNHELKKRVELAIDCFL